MKSFLTFTEDVNLKKINKSLDHPWKYARDMKSLENETQLKRDEILKLIKEKPINVFTFKGEEYVGLSDRKPEYEKDKKLGINPFESNYKGDEHRDKMNNGKPRFRQS